MSSGRSVSSLMKLSTVFNSSAIALITLFVVSIAIIVDAATITKITPRAGSLLGGTRLTVLGTGFDMRGRSNDIYIGSGIKGSFCDPVPNECTPERIVCLTGLPGEGKQPLSVRSFGFLADCQVSSGCDFEYTASRTPEVTSVTPQWVADTPTPITVSGRRFSRGDPTVAAFDFTLHLGEEERCELLGSISYSSFKCAVHSMRPGTLPLDLVHGERGRAKWSTKNTLLVIPTISGVSPSAGSINGGNVITIFGTSFSNVLEENEIRIHGSLCPVVSYSPSYVTCRTSASVSGMETSSPSTPAWQYDKALQEYWYNLPGGSIQRDWYEKLAYLRSHHNVLANSAQSLWRNCENCAIRTTFYFYAAVKGTYNFSGYFDDDGEVWVSKDTNPVERVQEEFAAVVLDVTPFNSRRVIAGRGHSSSHLKGSIELEKGWHWSRIYLKQGTGGIHQTVYVTYPNGTKIQLKDVQKNHDIAYRDSYTPPVKATVRGIEAHYVQACRVPGACRFDYKLGNTAVVSSVTNGVDVTAGTLLTITGTGFDSSTSAPDQLPYSCDNFTQCGGGSCSCRTSTECGLYSSMCAWNGTACNFKSSTNVRCNTWSRNVVTLCKKPCYVTSQSSVQIVCSVGHGISAGECPVEVDVGSQGRAISAAVVSVKPTISGVSPTSGYTTGGNVLTVVGAGFDPTPGATTVTVDGNDCPIPKASESMKTITYWRIYCTIPSSTTTGLKNVVVHVRGQYRTTARDIFAWEYQLNRPGTTQEKKPVSVTPMYATLLGRDRILISAPGKSFPENAQVTVKFGTFNCPVLTKTAETIVCEAPQLSAPMSKVASVTIKSKDGMSTLHSFDTPTKVHFNNFVTSTSRWMNPGFAQRVYIYGKFQVARFQDVSVSVYGAPCKNVRFDPYYQRIDCDAPKKPAASAMPALPSIAFYDFKPAGFTNVLHSMHASSGVTQFNSDSTVTIPAGFEYVITKRIFKRPFAFEATVRPTKTTSQAGNNARIVMRFCLEDPTAPEGYHAAIGLNNEGKFGLGRDSAWTQNSKEYTGNFAGIGLDPSSPVTMRVEAFNEAIIFYVNNVEAGILRDTTYLSGKLGFGFSRQQFTVSSYKVSDLYPLSTQVNISNVPARSQSDALYNPNPIQASSMPRRNFKKGDTVHIYVNAKGGWSRRVLALRSATEQPSEHTPVLCYGSVYTLETGGLRFSCTAENLPAGNYHWLFMSDYDGAASQSFSGSFQSSLASVISGTETGATVGGIVQVSGYGFTSASAVKVGTTTCTTIWFTEHRIACKYPAIGAGVHAVSVSGSTCSGCSVTIAALSSDPQIGSISPTGGVLPRSITVKGINFPTSGVKLYIDGFNCDSPSMKTSTEIRANCNNAGLTTGSKKVIVHFSNSPNNAALETTFNVQAGASGVTPTKGSAYGGTVLTVRSNALPTGATSVLAARDFKNGAEPGWVNSPSTSHVCNGIPVLGMMTQRSLYRQFNSVSAHVAVLIRYKIMQVDWQRFEIVLDDKQHFEIGYQKSFSGSCLRDGHGKTSYLSEGWVILPHNTNTLKVEFTNGGSGSSWGIASYSVELVSTLQQSLTIGGSSCAISSVTPWETTCQSTPSNTAGTTASVSLTVGGTEYCAGCMFTYDAAETPTITNMAESNLPWVNDSDTKVPQIAAHPSVDVTISKQEFVDSMTGETMKMKAASIKKTGSNSWWNGWFYVPFAMRETDAAVNGISVVLKGTTVMIGLTARHINDESHGMLDYAIYYSSGRLYAYRRGAYANTLEYAYDGDEITVAYERDCGCIRAKHRPKSAATAHEIYAWPAAPAFPLYPAGVIHNMGSGLEKMRLLHPRAERRRVFVFGDKFQNFKPGLVPDTSAITIGGTNCDDVYISNNIASCWVSSVVSSKTTYNSVRLRGKSGYSQTTDITRAQYAVSLPNYNEGSTAGGHELFFAGSGFTSATTVSVGGVSCVVSAYNTSYLKCKTGSKTASTNQNIVVSTSGNTHTCVKTYMNTISRAYSTATPPDCVYTYKDSASISTAPTKVKSYQTITIDGANFVTTEKPKVLLSGKHACDVTSYTSTQIMCKLGVIHAGSHQITVSWMSFGDAKNPQTATVDLDCQWVTPDTMQTGNGGEALVTFYGVGFGQDGDGAAPVTIKVAGTDLCTTIKRADTKMYCTTTAGNYNNNIDLVISTKSNQTSTTFVAAATHSPTVSAFSPSRGGRGTILSITGTRLSDATIAYVGTAKCEIISKTSTLVVCRIVDVVQTGNYVAVSVVSQLRGKSAGLAGFTGFINVWRTKPITAPWSKNNLNISVIGNGFGDSTTALNATVGGAVCAWNKFMINDGDFDCVIPKGKSGEPGNNDVDVTLLNGTATSTTTVVQYTYSNTISSTVTSISQSTGSAAGMEYIRINGTGFSTTISDFDVRIGGVPCYVVDATSATSFLCITSPMPIQDGLDVSVVLQSNGRSSGTLTFNSRLNIDSVSSQDVSVEGGLVLTITGTGFWDIPDQNSWKYQRALLNIGGRPCPIKSSTTTQILCTLRPTEITPHVYIPALVSSYQLPPEAIGSKITLKLNEVDATVASAAVVNFRHTSTPRVSSVSGSSTVTITGTNFGGNGNVVDYASAPCSIVTETSTQIVCNVQSQYYNKGAPVRVNVPGLGYTAGQVSCAGGSYLTCDGTCIKDENCIVAEWGMSTCRDLAHLIMSDTFCHSNGGTDRVGLPFRSDDGTILNFNCPLYSCEGGDCDSYLSIGGIGARVNTCGPNPSGPVRTLAPVISSLSSTTSSQHGGLLLTVTGSGFPLSNTSHVMVSIAGSGCTVVSTTASQVVCRTGAVSGPVSNADVRVYAKRVLSTNLKKLSYAAASASPILSSVSPTSLVATKKITVVGTGFSASSKVLIGNKYCTNVVADASQVVCDVPHQTVVGAVSVRVDVPGMGYSNPKTAYMRLRTLSVTPQTGSQAGGTTVTIVGSGFSKDTTITFGTSCKTDFLSFTESTSTLVVKTHACTSTQYSTSHFGSTSTNGCAAASSADCRFNFDSGSTPVISSVSFSAGTATIGTSNLPSGTSQSSIAIDFAGVTCTVTSFSTSTTVCTYSEPMAGSYHVNYHVDPVGYASATSQHTSLHSISSSGGVSPTTGSLGGGQRLTITGTGFAKGSHYKANKVTIGSTVDCMPVSATYTQIVCVTGAVSSGVADRVIVQINQPKNVKGWVSSPTSATSTETYTYDANVSPTVTSVDPSRGSTAGGTVITLVGTKLANTMNVTIGGVECKQTSAQSTATTATEYKCTTGAHKTMMEPARLIVATANNVGNAITTQTYQYVDLWSRFTTWGNTPPPIAGDSAVISTGQTVMVDYSPPRFRLIIVMGHLLFDPTADINFECIYIMINYGRFTVGTPEKPYLKRATITLHGDRLTPEIPVHGSKVIALRHGALDMHGEVRQPTWTHLAYTARAQGAQIFVAGPIDWRPGEFVVVASTDFHHEHTEVRQIMGVFPADGQSANVSLVLEYPLKYEHYGERQCFGTDSLCVNEVAEVGLLTRNIVVQGERNSMNLGFGGTMFLMPMGENKDRYARLSYVEFNMVGQQFIVGRYPVHYHVTHESNNSYVNGTSVHHSLNRAFSIHGISNNTYVNNVAHEIHGHAFFIEDGSERFNVIDRNFVSVARVSTSNLNTDLTPANFWMVSMTNKVTNNAAGGGDAYGFWISPFHPHSTGPTHSTSDCPATSKLWEFHHNVAHSNHKYGFNVFQFWWPKENECDFSGPDAQAVLHDLTSYKNQIWGITYGNHEVGQVGSIIWENILSADNGDKHPDASAFWVEKIKAKNMTNGLRNAALFAYTNNQPNTRSKNRRGINLPLGDNFFSENVTFVNYDGNNHGYEPQAWAQRMSLCFPYGWEAVSRQLSFVSSPNRVLFRFHHHGILNDEDGTLTAGTANSQLIAKSTLMDMTVCRDASVNTKVAGIICPDSYKIRRFFTGSVSQFFRDQDWTIESRNEIVPVITRAYIMTAPVNKKIQIKFNTVQVPDVWSWAFGGPAFMQQGEKALFNIRHNESRHHVYAFFDGQLPDKNYKKPAPTLLESTNSYSFDNNTGQFHALLNWPTRTMQAVSFNCPDEGCPLPPLPPGSWDKACKPFELTTSWDAAVVPTMDLKTDLFVNANEVICLGTGAVNAPSTCSAGTEYDYEFRNLRLEGAFKFANEHCPCDGAVLKIKVTGYLWIRQGGLLLGNATHKLTRCTVRISVTEPNWDDLNVMAPITQRPWNPRSIILESGMLLLNGQVPSPMFARLAVTAKAGATTIVMDQDVNWAVGDTIHIAGTQRLEMYTKAKRGDDIFQKGINQRERVKIRDISADKRTIKISASLRFEHFGGSATLDGKTYEVGAEVAVLNRNIVIDGDFRKAIDADHDVPKYHGGWQLAVGCTPDNYQGCAAFATSGWPMTTEKPGYMRIEGTWMRNPGQGGMLHGAIDIDGLQDRTDAEGSFFRYNVIERPYQNALVIRHTTKNLRVEYNLIVDAMGDGIMAIGKNNSILGNLVMGGDIPFSCEDVYHIFQDCRTSAFRLHGANSVRDNIAANPFLIGYLTEGVNCNAVNTWSNNFVHSGRDGVVTYTTVHEVGDYKWQTSGTDTEVPSTCRKIGGITAYWNGDHGFAAWYATGSLILENFASIENTIGIAALLQAPNNFPSKSVSTATYRNLVVAGFFDGMKCRSSNHHWKCINSLVNSKSWCTRVLHSNGLNRKIGNAGILETVFVSPELRIGRTKGEKKFRWEESDSYATLVGQAHHENIVFANFDGNDACGLRNIAFHNNIFSNDTFKHHTFKQVRWAGTVQNGGEFWSSRTYGDARFPTFERLETWYLDYDNPVYGGYWPDAPNKMLLVDLDGSFTKTGTKSHIVVDQSMVRPTKFDKLGYDGRAFARGGLDPAFTGCTEKLNWNAHLCDSNFEYMSFTIDSLAEDSLTRRPGPVVLCNGDGMIDINGWPLCQGGGVQYASGPVPKGKVQRATLDRITRYKFHALDRSNNTLSFRGSPPAWMRLILHDNEHTAAGSSAGITVNLRFFGLNSQLRMGIYVDGVRQRPVVGYGFPWDMSPSQNWPGPRDTMGTHFHNKLIADRTLADGTAAKKQYNVLYFTMRPGAVLEIKAEEIVQITMNLAMPLDAFFNQKDTFVIALATVLGIDSKRLKFANIVPGSTRRRLSSNTIATIDAALRDGDAQTSYDSTSSSSVNDFSAILRAVDNIPTTVGGVTVSSATAEIIQPTYPKTPVRVTSGTPYIACNATKSGANINSTEMQIAFQKWYLVNKANQLPYNETAVDEAGISNVFHDTASGWSQVVMSLGYEDNIAIRDGLQFIYPKISTDNTTAGTVFPGHQFKDCVFEMNGWCDGCSSSKFDSDLALKFGLGLGLSLFVLICIGLGVGYYYFYIRPKSAAKQVEKQFDTVAEGEPVHQAGEDMNEKTQHPADQYDELGRKFYYDEEGNPYWVDEEGRSHFYHDTHSSEAPMFDEIGRQYYYDQQGNPFYIDPETGNPAYYN